MERYRELKICGKDSIPLQVNLMLHVLAILYMHLNTGLEIQVIHHKNWRDCKLHILRDFLINFIKKKIAQVPCVACGI